MNLHFKGICLLFLVGPQLGLTQEQTDEGLQANEAAAESAVQAPMQRKSNLSRVVRQ